MATQSPGPVALRPLVDADAPRLGAMLGRAFAADPTSDWLFPKQEGRERILEEWYCLNVRVLLAAGEGWGTERLDSAALWLPMGALPERRPPRQIGRFLRWNLESAWRLGRRLPQAAMVTARVHRLHPGGPGWYLALLGTDPARQGQGLGSAVMAPVLSRCDQGGIQAYLDTATLSDVRFYQGRGFEVVGELQPARGPHFWIMRRPPAIA